MLSTRTHQLVDLFSKGNRKGDDSVNLSMQLEGSDRSTSSDVFCLEDINQRGTNQDKRGILNRSLEKNSDGEGDIILVKKGRLNVSLNGQDKPSTRRKISVSTDDINTKKLLKKKFKKLQGITKKYHLKEFKKKQLKDPFQYTI